MANVKISELPDATLPLAGTEETPSVQAGVTVKAPASAYGPTAFTGAAQGDIFYASASGVVSRLAKNTSSNRYLSNAGASNNPAWATVAGDISIGKSMSATYSASITNPTSLTFSMKLQTRPMELACPKLQLFFDDMMQDCGFYTASGNIGTNSYTQSQLQLASTAATFGNSINLTTKQQFECPMWFVAMEDVHRTTDANANSLGCGVSNGTNLIYCFMESGSGTNNSITLAKFISGVFTAVASTANGSLPSAISGLGISSTGQGTYYVWQNVSNLGWIPVLGGTINDANMMTPSVLSTYNPWLSATGGLVDKWRLGGFRTGITGQTFMRDFRIVTLPDGTPYVSDGYMYFTATTDACCVYRMNPKSGAFEKVGQLLFNRSGTLFADLNADIIYDPDNNLWRVFWATWGNNSFTNVRMFYATYKGDILNGFHIITGGTQLTLSQTSGNNATYDESVVYDAANSRWLMAYTLSPSGAFGGNFYAVLDQSTDLVTWTNVWAQSATTGYEGSWINCMGGTYFVTAGNGSNFRCWNLAGTNLGTLSVSSFPSPGSNPPPHFIAFPWFDGGVTEYYALSWNNTQFSVAGSGVGTFATGTPVLYKATSTETGFEFDPIGIR